MLAEIRERELVQLAYDPELDLAERVVTARGRQAGPAVPGRPGGYLVSRSDPG